MKFDLKSPCKDCPFIIGSSTNTTLREGRLETIVSAIRNDKSFVCHKTLDLNQRNHQHCAGALIFLEREGSANQMTRITERLGIYHREELNMRADIIDPS